MQESEGLFLVEEVRLELVDHSESASTAMARGKWPWEMIRTALWQAVGASGSYHSSPWRAPPWGCRPCSTHQPSPSSLQEKILSPSLIQAHVSGSTYTAPINVSTLCYRVGGPQGWGRAILAKKGPRRK